MEDCWPLGRKLKPTQLSGGSRDYYLERRYPLWNNLVPRDVASERRKKDAMPGYGVNATGEGGW